MEFPQHHYLSVQDGQIKQVAQKTDFLPVISKAIEILKNSSNEAMDPKILARLKISCLKLHEQQQKYINIPIIGRIYAFIWSTPIEENKILLEYLNRTFFQNIGDVNNALTTFTSKEDPEKSDLEKPLIHGLQEFDFSAKLPPTERNAAVEHLLAARRNRRGSDEDDDLKKTVNMALFKISKNFTNDEFQAFLKTHPNEEDRGFLHHYFDPGEDDLPRKMMVYDSLKDSIDGSLYRKSIVSSLSSLPLDQFKEMQSFFGGQDYQEEVFDELQRNVNKKSIEQQLILYGYLHEKLGKKSDVLDQFIGDISMHIRKAPQMGDQATPFLNKVQARLLENVVSFKGSDINSLTEREKEIFWQFIHFSLLRSSPSDPNLIASSGGQKIIGLIEQHKINGLHSCAELSKFEAFCEKFPNKLLSLAVQKLRQEMEKQGEALTHEFEAGLKIQDPDEFVRFYDITRALPESLKAMLLKNKNGQTIEKFVLSNAAIIKEHDKFMNHFGISEDNHILLGANKETHIPLATLLKVLKEFKIFQESGKEGGTVLMADQKAFVAMKQNHAFSLFEWPSWSKESSLQPTSRKDLGSGAFGSCYAVLNIATGAFEALKNMHNNADAKETFATETLMLKHLNRFGKHPNLQEPPHAVIDLTNPASPVAPVYGYTIRLIEEGDLTDWLSRGKFDQKDLLAIGSQLLDALYEFSMVRGLRHNDIKPDNVLMDAGSIPKIADWGSAAPIIDDDIENVKISDFKPGGNLLTDVAALDHQESLRNKAKELLGKYENALRRKDDHQAEKIQAELKELRKEYNNISRCIDFKGIAFTLEYLWKSNPQMAPALVKEMRRIPYHDFKSSMIEDFRRRWKAI